MRWYKKLWFKFVLEGVVTVLLWISYYIVRHVLPKKYRVNDSTLKKWMKDFSIVTTNLAANDDGVGDVLKKSQNVFDYFYDQRSRIQNTNHEFKIFIRDLMDEVDVHKNGTFTQMILPKLESFGDVKVIHEISALCFVVKMTFIVKDQPEPVNFYMMQTSNERTEYSTYDATFACSKGFKYYGLANLLFEMYENRLYLSVKNDILSAEKLEQEFNQEDYLLPQETYDNLLNEITKFREQNIQRSYIIYGPPGTGKTSFCLELSKKISGKILKIDSKVFTELSTNQTRTIIEGLECDFIIVDDIDRISIGDLAAFLYMLETLKAYKQRPTLLATVNNLSKLDSAILRPGRFDDIIEFNLPNKTGRAQFLKTMMARYDITHTKEELAQFVVETEGLSQAYLKEYCMQLRIEKDFHKLTSRIKRRKKYITQTRNHYGDDATMEENIAEIGTEVIEDD